MNDQSLKYSTKVKFMQWLCTTLIFLCFGIVVIFKNLNLPEQDMYKLYDAHKVIGMVTLIVVLIRALIRLCPDKLPYGPEIKPLIGLLANLTHLALYFLIFAAPLKGFIMITSRADEPEILGTYPT